MMTPYHNKNYWNTEQYGSPESEYFNIMSEYHSRNGSILMQFNMDAEGYYHVRFTATKKSKILPTITLKPIRDYDTARLFAITGMEELERTINDNNDDWGV